MRQPILAFQDRSSCILLAGDQGHVDHDLRFGWDRGPRHENSRNSYSFNIHRMPSRKTAQFLGITRCNRFATDSFGLVLHHCRTLSMFLLKASRKTVVRPAFWLAQPLIQAEKTRACPGGMARYCAHV